MPDRIYRFAEFELNTAEAELRTANSSVRLQEKPLLVLKVLVEHPQTLISRQQLRESMWDRDTFVDYEQGINVAIKKVRDALGDTAENPRFIQTVAKKGYRFLLPVELVEPPPRDRPETPSHLAVTRASEYPDGSRRGPLLRSGWRLAMLGVGVFAVLVLWLFHVQTAKARYPTQIHSLAVLPLRNLSPDSGQDYFADGVTEEVITNLAQSLPLRIISRTSVMRYRDTSEPVTQIARELGVEAIVEGAVARSGNRVTVTVQLIDAAEDRHLWARKYDRDLKDVLDIETEVSHEIAAQVGATLAAQPVLNAAKSGPLDPAVYELCLLGRYHWNQRTAASLAKSAEYYQQAIDRDPNYAPAYAGLASAYALMPSYNSINMKESYTKATTAAHHALELDDTLAEAHAALGMVGLNWAPAWGEAGAELRRALELNPNSATAHHWFAFYLLFVNRDSEAVSEMERARQLDPLSMIVNADEGHFLYQARRYQEARTRLEQAIELGPEFAQPHETLALVDLETGHVSDALKEARTSLALDASDPATMGVAGYVLASNGQTVEARKLLATVNQMIRRGSAYPCSAAFIYMGLGERNQALAAIEQNAKIGPGVRGVPQWHVFDQLRADPRYQKLLFAQPSS